MKCARRGQPIRDESGERASFRQITLITLLVGAIALLLILINTERLSRSLIAGARGVPATVHSHLRD